MKRSLKFMGLAAGAVSLLAAGLGCSHEPKPAEAPAPGGTTSPPFESNVGPNQPAQPSTPEMGAPTSPQPGEQPQAGAPQAGQPGAITPQPQTQPSQPGTMGAGSERELCDALASTADMKTQDIPNGVAIVLKPKGGTNMSTLHDDVRRIDSAMHAGTTGGETCGLFTLGRLPGVSTQVAEHANSVLLTITTRNPAEVKDLRRQAKDEVNNLGKSPPRP